MAQTVIGVDVAKDWIDARPLGGKGERIAMEALAEMGARLELAPARPLPSSRRDLQALAPARPLPPSRRDLQALATRRRQPVGMRKQELTRVQQTQDAFARASITRRSRSSTARSRNWRTGSPPPSPAIPRWPSRPGACAPLPVSVR